MEEAFGYVLYGVVAVGVIVAIATFATSGEAFKQIGKGGLFGDDDAPPPEPSVSAAVIDAEARQMLQARSDRRVRKGLEPLDVEAELAALKGSAGVDPAIEAEVRELVVARNARRARQGKPPLDVEAEVRRRVAELG